MQPNNTGLSAFDCCKVDINAYVTVLIWSRCFMGKNTLQIDFTAYKYT